MTMIRNKALPEYHWSNLQIEPVQSQVAIAIYLSRLLEGLSLQYIASWYDIISAYKEKELIEWSFNS
jgi:hypothetical protein